MKKIFYFLVILGALSVSSFAFADGIDNPLQYDTFEDMTAAIIRFLFTVGIAIAPILFAIGGIMIATAGGNPQQVQKAQKLMLYTAIGLAVILFAQGLVSVLKNVLGVEEPASGLPLLFSVLGINIGNLFSKRSKDFTLQN